MAIERILLLGMAAVLVVAPLPFGSVEPTWSAAIASACLLLGGVWIAWRVRRGTTVLPWKEPLLLAGGLLLLIPVLQQVPLPRSWLREVSPRAAELRDRYEPPEETSPPAMVAGAASGTEPAAPLPRQGWRPISLYAWATWQATFRTLGFLVAALLVLDLAALAGPRRTLIGALVASGGFQAVYGLAEFLSGRQHIFGYVKKHYTEVATGTFINRNHFAGYLEMTLPLVLALAASSFAGTRSGRGTPVTTRLGRLTGREVFLASAYLVLALIMAAALLCSGSRMGLVSLLLALLVVWAYLAWRGAGKAFAVSGAIVGGATILVFLQSEVGSTLVERFLAAPEEFRGQIGRMQIWDQALGVIGAFPLLGAGLGTFPHVFPAFRDTGPGVGLAHAHNDFLETAAEIGLVGWVLLLVGAVLVGRRWLRRPAVDEAGLVGYASMTGVVALGFHSLTDFNLSIPGNLLTLSALLGLALWPMRSPSLLLGETHESARSRVMRAASAVGVLGACALLSVTTLAGGSAERLFLEADRSAGPAIEDLQALAQVMARGEAPSEEAALYIGRQLDRAAHLQAQGLRRHPLAARGHLQRGRIEVARCASADLSVGAPSGCLGEALGAFQDASALAPMNATLHAQVARILAQALPAMNDGEKVSALVLIERARDLNPGDPTLQSAAFAPGPGVFP